MTSQNFLEKDIQVNGLKTSGLKENIESASTADLREEDEFVKIDNNLEPCCDKFWHLVWILEHTSGLSWNTEREQHRMEWMWTSKWSTMWILG